MAGLGAVGSRPACAHQESRTDQGAPPMWPRILNSWEPAAIRIPGAERGFCSLPVAQKGINNLFVGRAGARRPRCHNRRGATKGNDSTST